MRTHNAVRAETAIRFVQTTMNKWRNEAMVHSECEHGDTVRLTMTTATATQIPIECVGANNDILFVRESVCVCVAVW